MSINKKPRYLAGLDVLLIKNLLQQHHFLSANVFPSLYLV